MKTNVPKDVKQI